MPRLRLLVAFLAVLTAGNVRAQRAERAAPPPLFAVYYVWYSTAAGPHAKSTGWLKQQAAEPLIGRYDSDDRDVVRWHMRLARAAGIRGFFVSWWGPGTWQDVPHLTETAFETAVLPVAEAEGFKVALMDETAQFHRDFDAVKHWAADYLAKYKDSPAYLKIDGKPVYYIYQVSFDPKLTPQALHELKTFVETRVGPVYWIVDKISNAGDRLHIPAEWLAANPKLVEAYAFYSTFSNFRRWRYDDLLARYKPVVASAHAAGVKMMVPVHPGHDNHFTGNKEAFVIPRDNGDTLRGYLRAAVDSGADYILLTSWNEWPETTVVEPAAEWDDPCRYLKIISEFNGLGFKPPPAPATRPAGR